MVCVYAIKSEVNGDIYVGMALDANKRLREHNSGKNRYTKGLKPWILIYTETHPDLGVRKKERKIFKVWGR